MVFVLASAGVLAHRGATGIVKQRMDAMEAIAGAMKALRGMMRGKQPYDAERVRAYARAIATHGGEKMTALFPEGSLKHPSRAKPAIWTDWERFSATARDLAVYAGALAATASNERLSERGGGRGADAGSALPSSGSEDLATMAPDAVFKRLQKTCSDCHRTFRTKN